jgi:hypothetical protein
MPEPTGRQIAVVREAEEPVQPWEMQPGETDNAFRAFQAYRDLGGTRSLEETARQLGCGRSQLERWSRRWWWTPRCAAWDRYLDEVRREEGARAAREETRRMYERHGAQIQAAIQALMVPVTALLRRMRDPEQSARLMDLEGTDAVALLKLVRDAANVLPDLMAAERLVRGEPSLIEEHRVSIEHEHSFASDVLRDPRAADLANELFTQIGRHQTER